jgi:probable HAF family extracellular repeat protein
LRAGDANSSILSQTDLKREEEAAMSMSSTFWRKLANHRRGRRQTERLRRRLAVEALEDRQCPSYVVTDLGTLGEGASQANAINEAGQVVGHSDAQLLGDELPTTSTYLLTHAFFWENGVMTDIRIPGSHWSDAHDINDSGQVVGEAHFLGDDTIPPQHAFLWDDGAMTDFGSGTDAHAINNAGQIIGNRVTVSGEGSGPVLWEDGVMYLLNDLLPAGTTLGLAAAMDINEHGQIAGVAYGSGPGTHFFLLSDDDGIYANGGAVLTDLGTQSNWQRPRVNNAGQVIAGNFLYSDGVATDLGFRAAGINDAGQIVGSSSGLAPHAVLWQNGQTTNLNNLVDSSSGWDLRFTAAINESGQIVGSGTVGGKYHAFLLTPSAMPDLTVGDAVVTEGNTGTTSAVFTVSLSAPSDQIVTVAYSTANGNATAGSDYQAGSGQLTFAPGETTRTIEVPVIGDRVPEANESFVVDLSSATNAAILDSQGTVTVVDDEPRINISDVTRAEGKKGKTTLFTFTVTLSAAYDQAVTMLFRTVNGTAKTSDGDYIAKTGTLTFAPGETTKTITITVKGDSKREANETFYLDLFGLSSNSLFTRNRGLGTILDDD